MNSAEKVATLILLTAFVAGCRHKTAATPPPAAQAPTVPVSTLAKNTPPPQLPPPNLPKVGPPGSDNTAPPEQPKPKKPTHHKPKSVAPESTTPDQTTATEQAGAKDQPPTQSAAAATEQASSGTGGDVSPIGQLSPAGESTDTPARHDILDEISSIEKGLNDIKRPLGQEEQTTATQIRTFLSKAKDALSQEDLDAARSLVTRAKVLFDELTKP